MNSANPSLRRGLMLGGAVLVAAVFTIGPAYAFTVPVPEPSSLALYAGGVAMAAIVYRLWKRK